MANPEEFLKGVFDKFHGELDKEYKLFMEKHNETIINELEKEEYTPNYGETNKIFEIEVVYDCGRTKNKIKEISIPWPMIDDKKAWWIHGFSQKIIIPKLPGSNGFDNGTHRLIYTLIDNCGNTYRLKGYLLDKELNDLYSFDNSLRAKLNLNSLTFPGLLSSGQPGLKILQPTTKISEFPKSYINGEDI